MSEGGISAVYNWKILWQFQFSWALEKSWGFSLMSSLIRQFINVRMKFSMYLLIDWVYHSWCWCNLDPLVQLPFCGRLAHGTILLLFLCWIFPFSRSISVFWLEKLVMKQRTLHIILQAALWFHCEPYPFFSLPIGYSIMSLKRGPLVSSNAILFFFDNFKIALTIQIWLKLYVLSEIREEMHGSCRFHIVFSTGCHKLLSKYRLTHVSKYVLHHKCTAKFHSALHALQRLQVFHVAWYDISSRSLGSTLHRYIPPSL